MRDAIETQDRPISNNLLGLNRGRSEDSDDAMDAGLVTDAFDESVAPVPGDGAQVRGNL